MPSYNLIANCDEDPFQRFEVCPDRLYRGLLFLKLPQCACVCCHLNPSQTEDERAEILESFAEFNLAVTIYGAMLENNTSEVASKMAAMDNATRNANVSACC